MSNDIVKGVVYDRGKVTLKGETKHLSLVCMIIASDSQIITQGRPEIVIMGDSKITNEINNLTKYKCPYKFGDISNAIVNISEYSPNDLEKIK
jgi:hypothetical protein